LFERLVLKSLYKGAGATLAFVLVVILTSSASYMHTIPHTCNLPAKLNSNLASTGLFKFATGGILKSRLKLQD